MITTDSNFNTVNAKLVREPVIIASIAYDYLSALVTDYNQWLSGTGGADNVTEQGSVRMIKAATDAMSRVTGLGDDTITLAGGEWAFIRIICGFDTQLTSMVLNMKADTANGQGINLSPPIEVEDAIGSATENAQFMWKTYGEPSSAFNAPTTSYADRTLTYTFPVQLYRNRTYLIFVENNGSDPLDSITIKQWIPNDLIFSNHYGYKEGALQLGCGRLADYDSQLYDTVNDFLDGTVFIKTLTLDGYGNTYGYQHTTAWEPVKNSSGTPTAPSVSGTLRVSSQRPIGTTVSVRVYGDADGSDAGQVDLGTIADGGSVTAYPYYKFVITMTTDTWSSTPIVEAVQVYFELADKVVYGSQAFGSYAPLLAEVPSFDVSIDPLACRVNLAEPILEIVKDRTGYDLAASWIEQRIATYQILNTEMKLYFGYQDIPEGSFINYARGILQNYKETENTVILYYRQQLFLVKDPLVISSEVGLEPILYVHENIIDTMLDIVRRSAPERSIDTTSFSTIKSSFFPTFNIMRPITETVKDSKTLLDELQLLSGCVVIERQDGKLYLINLFDETTAVSATLDDDNSDEVGKCEFNYDKRINICTVRRGYWDESTLKESPDKFYQTSIDAMSVQETGRNKEEVIENKWLTLRDQVDTRYTDLVVAERMTSFFGYGMWIVKRMADDTLAYLQEGDFVNVTGNQILHKDISNPATKRGVIISRTPRVTENKIEFKIWLIKPLIPTIPANAPTSMTFTGLSTTGMTVNWTKGTGSSDTVLVGKKDSAPSSPPVAGQIYAEGDLLADGSKIFYSGTGSSKAITGLNAQEHWYFRAYAANVIGRRTNYKTDSYLSGNEWTDSTEPANQPTQLRLTVVGSTSIKVDWDAAAGGADQYLLLYHATTDVSNVPVDGNGYTAGGTIGADTVGYSGTGLTVTLNGLTNGVTYYVKVFSLNGFVDAKKNYKTGTPLSGNKTCSVTEPTAQITSFSLEVSYTPKRTCLLSWTEESPKATGIIILAKSGTISDTPTDSTVYAVGSTIGSSVVVYLGDSSAEACTVIHNTYDNFKAFTYNDNTTPNYYLTGAPTAIEA